MGNDKNKEEEVEVEENEEKSEIKREWKEQDQTFRYVSGEKHIPMC